MRAEKEPEQMLLPKFESTEKHSIGELLTVLSVRSTRQFGAQQLAGTHLYHYKLILN